MDRIGISPFSSEQINPNSYDFRLGSTIKVYKNHVLDPKVEQEVIRYDLDAKGMLLNPDCIYLANTEEFIGSDYYVPIIRAKSSIARMGLFVHVTADLVDIGFYNQLTLQLHAVQPVYVYPGMKIGQVTFWEIVGDIKLYTGKYKNEQSPVPTQIYKDFI